MVCGCRAEFWLMFCVLRSLASTSFRTKCVPPTVYSSQHFLCDLRQSLDGSRTKFTRQFSENMSAEGGGAEAKLAAIPDVEIDLDGKFKYILIRCHGPGDVSKDIVRGFAWAEFHDHIYKKVKPVLDEQQIQSEVLGGGKITHESAEKKIHVYGKSTGFGQADHSIAVEKLKKKFPDYASITFNNEGY